MNKGILRVTDILLRDILLLPDNYELVDTRHNAFNGETELLFESPDIPNTTEGNKLPMIRPQYVTHHNQMFSYPELTEIKYE